MSLNKEKLYKTAPLPFQGQKRRFITAFTLAMSELKGNKDIRIIVDLFGGSGLLSHNAKKIFPEARVIYNDFDNYSIRLRNVDKTNRLLGDIRSVIGNAKNGERLDPVSREKIIHLVEKEDISGYVDYITLSSSLMFSAKYVLDLDALKGEHLYNNVKTCDYDFDPDEYLAGLEIVRVDYKKLYELIPVLIIRINIGSSGITSMY